jgi:RHS repeat-associated protein
MLAVIRIYLSLAFLFILVLFSPLQAEDSESQQNDPFPMAHLAGLPNATVNGSINTINGNYGLVDTMLVIPAIKPIIYQYSYNSLSGSSSSVSHKRMDFKEVKKNCYLVNMPEPLGGSTAFISWRNSNKSGRYYNYDSGMLKWGLTNCSGDGISAQTNVKNHKMTQYGVNKSVANLPSGVVREYSQPTWLDKKHSADDVNYLIDEIDPNGNFCHYSYKTVPYEKTYRVTALTDISNYNSDRSELFNSLHFCDQEFDAEKKIYTNKAIASDGREVSVITSNDQIIPTHNKQFETFYTRPEGSWIYYLKGVRKEKLGKPGPVFVRVTPNQHLTVTDYYGVGNNDVGGKIINIPHEKSPVVGRVAMQSAPVGTTADLIPTARFFYTININQDSKHYVDVYETLDGYTDVYDALDNHTRYHYTKENRLFQIDYFDQNDTLHHRESFIWGEIGSDLDGHLVEKQLKNASDEIYFREHYDYDPQGNILKHSKYGDLKGDGTSDEYCLNLTYTDDGRNLLSKEEFPNGKIIHYRYHNKKHLLTAQFTEAKGSIQLREFFSYDHNNSLIEKILDDGSNEDPIDLSGVSERHITRISPRKEAPAYGLPEVISEYVLDLSKGSEILLSRKELAYTKSGRINAEKHYDAENHYLGTVEYAYDEKDRVIFERNLQGHEVHRKYDENGNKIYEKGPGLDSYENYVYDFSDRLIKKEVCSYSGESHAENYTYDYLGNLVCHSDIFGNETQYSYDAFSQCVEERQAGILSEYKSLKELCISRTYDSQGNVISLTDAAGDTSKTEYNALGKPTKISYSDGSEELYTYTLEGEIKSHTARHDVITKYIYDYQGRQLAEEKYSKNGDLCTQISHKYTAFHKVSTSNAEGQINRCEYDAAGRLSKTIMEGSDGQIQSTYLYDSLGRRSHCYQASGTVEAWEYDILGNVIEERIEDADGSLSQLKQYSYDERGNRIAVTEYIDGEIAVTQTDYNFDNKIQRIVDPLGHETHITYDYNYKNLLGQYVLRKTKTDPLGKQEVDTYDAQGNIVHTVIYDLFLQPLSEKRHLYTAKGNRCRTDESVFIGGSSERVVTNLWLYGTMQRLETLIEALGTPEQKSTNYLYDGQGRKSQTIKADGVSLFESYDNLGRLADHYSSDKSFHYQYVYDKNDNIIKVHDLVNGSQIQRCYDDYQRMSCEIFPNKISMAYSYDQEGRCTQLTLPDQSMISYSYSAANMSAVSRKNNSGEKTYTHQYMDYDLSGRLLRSQAIINAGSNTYQYDLKGRLKDIKLKAYTFTDSNYDAAGNLLHCSESDSFAKYDSEYSYDALYQLEEETGASKNSYRYDSINNRIEKNGTAHSVNALNQLLDSGKSEYVYDQLGNLRKKDKNEEITEYFYDALDRLTTVQVEGKYRAEYKYDSFNRRLSKKVYSVSWWYDTWKLEQECYFFYHGDNEIGSCNSEQKIKELRVLGVGRGAEIGATTAVELDGEIYAAVNNCRGDLISLVNPENGKVVTSYRYTAYGEPCKRKGRVDSPWRFASKRIDSETGLSYFGRRYYDPEIGKWLTMDPQGFDDGPNLYAYVHNSPLTHFDLYGLCSLDDDFYYGGSITPHHLLGGVAGTTKAFAEAGTDLIRMGAWGADAASLGNTNFSSYAEKACNWTANRENYNVLGCNSKAYEACFSVGDYGTQGIMLASGAGALYKVAPKAFRSVGKVYGACRGAKGASAALPKIVKTTVKGSNSACNSADGAKLNRKLLLDEIVDHSFEKHVVKQGEFSELGIHTKDQFRAHTDNVLNNPSSTRYYKDGRHIYLQESTGTLVVRNPGSGPSTTFRPENWNVYNQKHVTKRNKPY